MPHALRIMSPVTKVALSDRFAMVLGRLVHPALRRVRVRVPVRPGTRPSPEQVLALARTFGRRRVLHVSYIVG